MKLAQVFLFIFLLSFVTATAQKTPKEQSAKKTHYAHKKLKKKKVPTVVYEVFAEKNPGIREAFWYRTSAAGIEDEWGADSVETFEGLYPAYYIVEYVDKMNHSVSEIYSPKGKLLTYHKEIVKSDLPDAVRKKLSTKFYQDWEIKNIRKQTRVEQQNDIYKVYYIKGNEEHIAFYDRHGYISQVRKRKTKHDRIK